MSETKDWMSRFDRGVNTVSTVVQVASALAGLVFMVQGNLVGALGLAALAGGARGTLFSDLAEWLMLRGGPRPPTCPRSR